MSELLNLAEYKQQLTEQISNLDLSDYELPNDFKRQFHSFGEYKIEEYYKYTIKVSSKKSVCYIPNQWVFIAAICSKYCIELKKYKQKLQSVGITDEDFESCHPSSSDKSIPDEHRTNEYVSKKATDLLSSYNGDDKDLLISFLWDYDSWGGGKNIKRDNDFTISPCLNVANSINASSSLIGDLAKAIGDDNNLYDSLMNSAEMDKIRSGVQIVKNELVRERLAASFLKMAMKTTLDLDKNLSGLEKTGKYKVTRKNLKIDGFWIGRDKSLPPTRDSDIYPDVSWSFNNKDYVLNVEITPKDMEEIFFPTYNDAYRRQLFMEKDLNGEYVLYKIIKSQQQIDLISIYPLQQIFYGAPGTGKSHRVKEIIKEHGIDEKEQVIRTTFHPDSDYSTFVGCYKPIMKSVPQTYVVEGNEKPVMADKDNQATKEEIVYDYTPQAFVQAYTKAWTTNEPVILVIEEINRGNCAQIFGDIFQLLDRGNDNVSEYEIKPDKALENYLREYFAAFEDVDEQIKSGKIMKLPSNLYIWATMNTSDQSLFPIDSAFKRRWEWKYIKIAWPYKKNEDGSFKTDENGKKIHFNYSIEGGHDWWEFLQQINAIIDKMTNSADKQLGYFFAKAKDDIISYDTFVSKVCFYLWNDIFKTYALDEQQGDLFSYKDEEGQKKQLTFPAFYDGDGNVIPEVVEAFINNVMNWNNKNDKA